MEQNKTKTGVPVLATSLIPGDEIAVNLVASSPGGERLSVAATFNHMGSPINAATRVVIAGDKELDLSLLSGTSAPEFPAVKYQELIDSGQREAAEDIKDAYELEVEEWKKQGNRSLADSITDAVLDWADRAHNVKTEDHAGPYISPDQVVVKQVMRSHAAEPGMFQVTLNPAWGA